VGEAYARARGLASTLNRPRALLIALWGQFMGHWARADLKQARQLADEMVDSGEVSGDVPTRVMGCNASALACFQLGEFTIGRTYAEHGLALYDPADRLSYAELPDDALVHLLVHSSLLLVCLGDLDRALSRRDAALYEARRLSHIFPITFALLSAWRSGRCVGLDPKSLLQCADELLALAVGLLRAGGLAHRGWCLAALGHPDEGIPLLTAGLAGYEELGFRAWRPWFLTLLGDAFRMAGLWQAALGHLAEARRLAEETLERWALAETLRLRGDVLAAMGDAAAAEASYHEAIAVAQQQSAKLWELRAAVSLARLWRDEGKRTEARDLLAPVYGWFTEDFATPVLQEAKALLEELSDAPASPTRAVRR
jgi:tetratricopeptide (TPR) repeat protein